MTILEEIANYATQRVEQSKKIVSLEQLKKEAFNLPMGQFEFEKALQKKEMAFICECKKASPSKGIIVQDFDYVTIAKQYEEAQADCISVLTEPKWFLGKDDYLKEIRENVRIPILRKDFIVDEYMIYEAKVLGANAILLICSILTVEQIQQYIQLCDKLGLSCLVEAHDENEIHVALQCKARLIGVNNRNLKDFTVDTNNSKRLRQLVPNDILFVSESGIQHEEDIKQLKNIGVNAVLIGESLMKASDKKALLHQLRSAS